MDTETLMDHTQAAKDYIAGCIGGKLPLCDTQINDCLRFENTRFSFVKLLRLEMVVFESIDESSPPYKTSSGTLHWS